MLAFITAQRTGRGGDRALQPVGLAEEPGGVSAATVRRRLSIVSGFFAFLQARGDVSAEHAAALIAITTTHEAWRELLDAYGLSWDVAEALLCDTLGQTVLRTSPAPGAGPR